MMLRANVRGVSASWPVLQALRVSGVFFSGSSRTRTPQAAKTALVRAGASGGTAGSPRPPSAASDRTNSTLTRGASTR